MSIEVGDKLSGKISGITHFGAFVDLGEGKTGLVHISEVSNTYVKDINEVLTVGDAVDVKVMSIGNDGKIGLSIKRLQEMPEPRREERAPRKEYRKPVVQQQHSTQKKQNFDDLMSDFMKESEDRLLSLKRNTEGKRGGRGGRRS